MSNILYISPYLGIGGTEKHLLDLVQYFSKDNKVFLLAPPGQTVDQFQAEKIEYYPFTRLDQKLFTGLKEFSKRLKEIVNKKSIDLIHIHGAPELMFLVKRVNKDIPLLFTVHGFHGPNKGWDYLLCAKLCNRYADKVISVATAEEEILLKKGIKDDLIQTIHNGVPDPLNKELKSPDVFKENDFDLTIGAVARLETTKGIHILLESFAKVVEEFSNLLLVIVGAGSKEEHLKSQMKELKLEHKVKFLGYKKNVHDYLNNYDIFVIPSLHEAHPLVLMEGMGHGKAIIATSVGGIPEVINHKENGMLIAPSNVEELSIALEELIKNQELRDKLGKSARKTYEKRFTVERMTEKTEDVYYQIL